MKNKKAISIIVWFVPVVISIFSLYQSMSSNNLAKQALIIGQRPYVTISAKKFDESKDYISAKINPNGVEIRTRFELINKGNSIAKNIKTSNFIVSNELFPAEPRITLKPEGDVADISLAPGEAITMELLGNLAIPDKNVAADLLDKIKENGVSFPFNLDISYDMTSDILVKGKTTALIIVKNSETEIRMIKMD
jgi:hypothetical protein